jgi:hypothetical protein
VRDWKACERKIAEILGGVRVPVTGRQRGATPDVEHPSLSIEVKFPQELTSVAPGCSGASTGRIHGRQATRGRATSGPHAIPERAGSGPPGRLRKPPGGCGLVPAVGD